MKEEMKLIAEFNKVIKNYLLMKKLKNYGKQI